MHMRTHINRPIKCLQELQPYRICRHVSSEGEIRIFHDSTRNSHRRFAHGFLRDRKKCTQELYTTITTTTVLSFCKYDVFSVALVYFFGAFTTGQAGICRTFSSAYVFHLDSCFSGTSGKTPCVVTFLSLLLLK